MTCALFFCNPTLPQLSGCIRENLKKHTEKKVPQEILVWAEKPSQAANNAPNWSGSTTSKLTNTFDFTSILLFFNTDLHWIAGNLDRRYLGKTAATAIKSSATQSYQWTRCFSTDIYHNAIRKKLILPGPIPPTLFWFPNCPLAFYVLTYPARSTSVTHALLIPIWGARGLDTQSGFLMNGGQAQRVNSEGQENCPSPPPCPTEGSNPGSLDSIPDALKSNHQATTSSARSRGCIGPYPSLPQKLFHYLYDKRSHTESSTRTSSTSIRCSWQNQPTNNTF